MEENVYLINKLININVIVLLHIKELIVKVALKDMLILMEDVQLKLV